MQAFSLLWKDPETGGEFVSHHLYDGTYEEQAKLTLRGWWRKCINLRKRKTGSMYEGYRVGLA